MSLENKVAIVTGAAGGIGFAIARRFLNDGAKVIIADVDDTRGEAAEIMDAARMALAGLGAHLSGHLLVNAGDPQTRLERLADGRTWRGRLRLRFVTEPAV